MTTEGRVLTPDHVPNTCAVRQEPDGVRVLWADDRIRISDDMVRRGLAGELDAVLVGEGLFQIKALNGTWTYQLLDLTDEGGAPFWWAALRAREDR